MNTRSIWQQNLALAAALALSAGTHASDWGQSFFLSAPDSNPASAIRFGEPAGTPPLQPVPPVAPIAAVPPAPSAGAAPATPPLPEPPEPPEPAEPDDVRIKVNQVRDHAIKLAREGQRIAEKAQRDVQRAVADVKRSSREGKRMTVVMDGKRRARTLLLPADDAPTETREQLNEDLTVMHRILARATGKRKDADTFRIAFDRPDAPEMDAMYLDGYGAVFLLSVNYPLVEPEKAKVKEAEDDGAKDKVWEETKRKLKSAEVDRAEDFGDPGATVAAGGGGIAVSESVVGFINVDTEAYDADKVAALRKKLTSALKHAANIRALKPEDTVTVVVTGRGPGGASGGSVRIIHPGGMDPALGQRYGLGAGMGAVDEGIDAGQSRLVLRAKKKDIDALAEGRVTPEQFAVKISVGRP